ncbi:MAG: restriction endonuclease subunit S, partial [Clostridiales bacterium]|nr:restriction endonuclease subunit S [Clostridiales bacterium]
DLSEAKVLIPTDNVYKNMGLLDSILNTKMRLRKQNKKLAELRDTLLPKLMSGEIRIPLD